MLNLFPKLILLLSLSTLHLASEESRKPIDFSMVISGGVSLGAYEAGYNWALIKMLTNLRASSHLVDPHLKSVAGASAGSINSLLSAIYWCKKESISLHDSITDNLFYETWVNLGIEDLIIPGYDKNNKSTLLSRRGLEKKGVKIIDYLKQPIFQEGCEVPLGFAVTKVTPVTEDIYGIKVKNQNFSVPLLFKVEHEKGIVVNKKLPPSNNFYISIPNIENDREKIINLLFASAAFPGAFQQVKLDYEYKGVQHSNYFMDGGLYDNVPLDLAIELDKSSSIFFFMAPSNMRKEAKVESIDKEEEMPLGFVKSNLFPVLDSFDIMQSMKLYEAINKHFRQNSPKKLILSSRYHPLSGEYLEHFSAFLDINFRIYDYHVGIYDAIYKLAETLKKIHPEKFQSHSQIEVMNSFLPILGIDQNSEALSAYKLFSKIEFYNLKPKTTDRFSAIYNAFNIDKVDAHRYDNEEFKKFLKKLDTDYLQIEKNSFLSHVKKNINNWHRRPLKVILERVTTLENNRAKVYEAYESTATLTSLGAWVGSSFLKEKEGLYFSSLDMAGDKGNDDLKTTLQLLPQEISTDIVNGGIGLGYNLFYYKDMSLIEGFESKASYMIADESDDFIRLDLNGFNEYDDFIKVGMGISFFGDMKGSFYKGKSFYGVNTYVDFLDILRFSYVRRAGDNVDRNYFYLGVENIPSLIYWLKR